MKPEDVRKDDPAFLDGAILAARDALVQSASIVTSARKAHAQAQFRLGTLLKLRNALPPYRQDVEPCRACGVGFIPGEVVHLVGHRHGNGGFNGGDPIHEKCAEERVGMEYLRRAGTGPDGERIYAVEDDAFGIGEVLGE